MKNIIISGVTQQAAPVPDNSHRTTCSEVMAWAGGFSEIKTLREITETSEEILNATSRLHYMHSNHDNSQISLACECIWKF